MAYVLCSYLVAQKIPINPNHSIYPYLYRQSTNGILPQWIQSARPLTIEQVLKSLNQIIESDKTNDNNRILAEKFLSEFKSPEVNGLNLPLIKNNKFQNLDNFTKKSLQRKYYATAGILKVKALEGSRLKQIDAAKDIDEDLVSKETLILKEVGPSYLEVYKDKVLKRINNNPKYDDGVKKILIDGYIKFGEESLASSMSVNQPFAFKDAVKKGQFNSLKTEEVIKYSAEADKQIKLRNFKY